MAIRPDEPTIGSPATEIASEEWHTYLFNRASWGAIVAGVVAALVIQLLLNLLGIGGSVTGLAAFWGACIGVEKREKAGRANPVGCCQSCSEHSQLEQRHGY